MLTKRQRHILRIFLESSESYTSQKLSLLLNVSSKTIRTEIKTLNSMIHDFALIQSIPSKGYYLEVIDEKKLEDYKGSFRSERRNFVPSNPLERVYYILGLMLKNQEFIKIDDISELLYIDRTVVSRNLKIVREYLDRFGLKMIQKNGKGLKIVGDEFNYRQCMAEYIYHKPEMFITEIGKNRDFIKDLKEVIFNDGITMPERVFYNFVIHIQVQLDRIKNKHLIHFPIDEIKEIENEYEFLVAKDVAKLINEYFGIELTNQEKDYLTIHILGKKSNSTSAIESCINNQLKEDINSVVQAMFNRIHESFGIDFSHDMYLRKAIGIHLHPMENRLKFNTYLRNPLIDSIKENYIYAYLMSLEACKVLSSYDRLVNIEDEIGYIAVHFQYALERRKRNLSKKRVLLINDYSVATGELLSFSISKEYQDRLIIEKTISASELNNYDLSLYDFLITTVSIKIESRIPVLRIYPIMRDKDYKLLDTFFKNDPRYVINDYLDREEIYCIDINSKEEFYQHTSIDIFDFELNHSFAIGYVLTPQKESKIAVYSFKKAVLWNGKFVRMIFVLYIGKNHEQMIEGLEMVLSKMKQLDSLSSLYQPDELYQYLKYIDSNKN